jgi:hypothetical protein
MLKKHSSYDYKRRTLLDAVTMKLFPEYITYSGRMREWLV